MRPNTIRKLIELVEESKIDVLEVTSWGRTVKITRNHPQMNGHSPHLVGRAQLVEQQFVTQPAAPQPAAPTQLAPEPAQPTETKSNLVEITSPMVGTFYTAPSPESPPFVKIGDSVEVGKVVCIVEAMKLMNEIESEVKGKVAEILVENSQPVEFGQPLFLIDPS